MSEGSGTRRACVVDAFTDEPLAGNPAGVVPAADGLTDAQMGAIAREINASETAFLLDSETADRRLRYFTPTEEVDLCGHATVASHALLAAEGLADGTHSLETNVGELSIELDDGTVWMAQNPPEVEAVDADYEALADALGTEPVALREAGRDLPVARASTGLAFLVVPVTYLERLGEMAPEMDAVEALSAAHDVRGVYAFTFDTLSPDATLHGRCFVPSAGVPEDPVTGTASGACGAYLDRFRAFDGTDGEADGQSDDGDAEDRATPAEMRFEQGHALGRPGLVRVEASRATSDGVVRIGGEAVVALDGELRVPPVESDDIIEA